MSARRNKPDRGSPCRIGLAHPAHTSAGEIAAPSSRRATGGTNQNNDCMDQPLAHRCKRGISLNLLLAPSSLLPVFIRSHQIPAARSLCPAPDWPCNGLGPWAARDRVLPVVDSDDLLSLSDCHLPRSPARVASGTLQLISDSDQHCAQLNVGSGPFQFQSLRSGPEVGYQPAFPSLPARPPARLPDRPWHAGNGQKRPGRAGPH